MSGARSKLLLALLIALFLGAWSSSMAGGFVWDDDDHITANEELRSVAGLGRIWTEPKSIPQYYPLTHTTWWLEYRLWGEDPTGYHVVNVLLHGLAAWLLWRVLLRLGIPGAGLAAMLFALHPVHVESVAWISERKNVLSGVFFLGALLAWLRVEERTRFAGAAFGLFVLALLSKTTTAALPAVLLVIVWWRSGRLRLANVVPLLPFFVVGLVAGLHTSHLERTHVGAMGPEWDFTLVERVLIAGRAAWFHLGNLAWPQNLTFIYPRWDIDAGQAAQYAFPVAAAAVVLALFLWRRRIGRGPLAAALLFGGLLVPALGFFNVFPMRYSFVADHFQYLASLGPLVLAAAGIAMSLGGRPAPLRIGGPAALLVVLAALTWHQGRAYASAETLWHDVLAKNPTAWIAHDNLALSHLLAGERAPAEEHSHAALALRPEHPVALSNLGAIRFEQERYAEARTFLERALASEPDLPAAHRTLGRIYQIEGNPTAALPHLRRAVEFAWQPLRERVQLAETLFELGELDEAEAQLDLALATDPDLAEAHLGRGRIFAARNDLEEAGRCFDRALALRDDWAFAWYLRGQVHRARGEEEAARACLDRAVDLDPGLRGAVGE